MVIGNLGCTTHGATMVVPAPAFDPEATLRTVQDERCTCALRRAHDVHRRAGPPGLPPLRPVQPADRDHGRLAVPGRGHEAVRLGDAHGRGDDLLRHDRDLAGVDADGRGRPRSTSGSAPSAGCTPTSRSRSSTPTPGASCPAGRPGELLHARLLGDARLLERAGEDGRGHRRRRLDAHRRPGDDGRRRLREHRRAHQGHDHPGRRERVPARDRGVPLRPPRHRRRAGDRRARRPLRRGDHGLGQARATAPS